MRYVDAVVIGGGSGGLTAARRLATAGQRTAIIEAGLMGGDCLNWGCVPTKALVATAKLRHQMRHAADHGIHVGDIRFDFTGMMARKTRVQAEIGVEEYRHYIAEPGVEVIAGTATFTGSRTISVAGEDVRFEQCIIATGSHAAVPAVTGLEEVGYLTNVTLLQLGHLPESLAVIGGGPVGCEFAQMFSRFGSTVTVVQRADRLLPREEHAASTTVAAVFAREGIDVRLQATVRHVALHQGRRVLHVVRGGQESTVEAEAILVATGRMPNIASLNLDAAGVKATTRGIVTDEHMCTSAPHIWAVGDVLGRYQFTHVAAEQGWLAAGRVLGKSGSYSEHAVPWCTFTDPEVARVGLTEAEAREKHGGHIQALVWPFQHVDRAVTMGEPDGFIKILTQTGGLGGLGGGQVVGAHIVGPAAGELIGELTMLVANHLPLGLLARTIHVYPTLSLGVRQAAAQAWETSPARQAPSE